MSNITIVVPGSLAEVKELASHLAQARTLPEALQKSPADIMALVMTGAELGLAPMQSLRGLVLIKGKPTLSADAMGALVKSRRDVCQYLMLRHSDERKATYEARRVGDPESTTLSFTIEDAQRAGLAGGDNWRKFPAAMLRARALSAICRAVFPDLLLGVYDPDELDAPAPVAQARPVVDAVATAVPVTPPVKAPASPPRRQLVVESDPLSAEVEALRGAIEAAKATGDLLALTSRLKALPEAERKGLRPVYDAKLKAIAQEVAK